MRPMAKLALGVAGAVFVILAGLQPATAACKKMGFLVNDYGKEGPTKDAQRLLDKHIAAWADEQGINEYTVGKKTVKCELYLNLIVFDEHTCTASATVCWGGSRQPKTQTAKKKKSSKKKTAKATNKTKSKVVKTVAKESVPKSKTVKTKTVNAAVSDTSGVETGTIAKAAPKPPSVPYAADAVIRTGAEATAEAQSEPTVRVQSAVAKPSSSSPPLDRTAVDRAAAAAERAAAAAERAAAAAQQAAEAAKQAAAARAAVVAPVVPTSARP